MAGRKISASIRHRRVGSSAARSSSWRGCLRARLEADLKSRSTDRDRATAAAGRASGRGNAWESAYLRFETPEQETRKFLRRLRRVGASRWPRDLTILELFCGRGNGLRALERLGFSHATGIDLSAALAAQCPGRGRIVVGDCRNLPYASSSRDLATIHGGLHHLASLPEDLERTLAEIRRVLKADGVLVVVEPWQTPFLAVAHALGSNRLAGRLFGKLSALGSMIENEGAVYRRWLESPQLVLDCLRRFFQAEECRATWGKLIFVGRKRPEELTRELTRRECAARESQSWR